MKLCKYVNKAMSRKFDRTEKIRQEAEDMYKRAITSPQFLGRLYEEIIRPKPKYIPLTLWKIMVRFILKK